MSEFLSLCVQVCVNLGDELEYLGSKDQTRGKKLTLS